MIAADQTIAKLRGVASFVPRGDSNIEISSDPTGEIRVFVYKQKMPAIHEAPAAPDGSTSGAGRTDGQQVQLKHTVDAERSTASSRGSR